MVTVHTPTESSNSTSSNPTSTISSSEKRSVTWVFAIFTACFTSMPSSVTFDTAILSQGI